MHAQNLINSLNFGNKFFLKIIIVTFDHIITIFTVSRCQSDNFGFFVCNIEQELLSTSVAFDCIGIASNQLYFWRAISVLQFLIQCPVITGEVSDIPTKTSSRRANVFCARGKRRKTGSIAVCRSSGAFRSFSTPTLKVKV